VTAARQVGKEERDWCMGVDVRLSTGNGGGFNDSDDDYDYNTPTEIDLCITSKREATGG